MFEVHNNNKYKNWVTSLAKASLALVAGWCNFDPPFAGFVRGGSLYSQLYRRRCVYPDAGNLKPVHSWSIGPFSKMVAFH